MNFNPTEKEIDFINKALTKFNDEKVGPDNHELLNIVEYDENGNIIAGILGVRLQTFIKNTDIKLSVN